MLVLPLKNNQLYKRNHKLKSLKSQALCLTIILIIILGLFGKIISSKQNIEKSDNSITFFSNDHKLVGTVSNIRDGDTIVVDTTPIRLNGLTCDELGTPLGDQAKLYLQNKVSLRTATCTLNGSESYDRKIGRCNINGLGDIGALMITSKLCGRCPRYDPKEKYLGVQKSAGPFTGVMPNYCK